jgi:hypothetical protein
LAGIFSSEEDKKKTKRFCMKKLIVWTIVIIMLIGIGGFVFYRYYLPDMVVSAMVEDDLPAFVPERVKAKIEKIKVPVNKGAEAVIAQIHTSDVTLEQIFKAIDQTDEEQVNTALDELQETKITNTDQAFNLFKKHFRADFDVEIFREPFNKNVDMAMIKKARGYAESYRNDEAMDTEMAKAVIKKILLQKEKEYRGK